MLGIGLKDIDKPDAYSSQNVILLYIHNGTFYTASKASQGGQPAVTGDVITIMVQPEHKRVVWFKNHTQIGQHIIP